MGELLSLLKVDITLLVKGVTIAVRSLPISAMSASYNRLFKGIRALDSLHYTRE